MTLTFVVIDTFKWIPQKNLIYIFIYFRTKPCDV